MRVGIAAASFLSTISDLSLRSMRAQHACVSRMAAHVMYGDNGHLCAVARVERSATRVGMFDRNPSSIGLLNVRPGFRAAARKRAAAEIQATARHLCHLWGGRHLREVPQTFAAAADGDNAVTDARGRHVWTAPSRQGLFHRFGKRIRCGHVSGLFARCMDRWP